MKIGSLPATFALKAPCALKAPINSRQGHSCAPSLAPVEVLSGFRENSREKSLQTSRLNTDSVSRVTRHSRRRDVPRDGDRRVTPPRQRPRGAVRARAQRGERRTLETRRGTPRTELGRVNRQEVTHGSVAFVVRSGTRVNEVSPEFPKRSARRATMAVRPPWALSSVPPGVMMVSRLGLGAAAIAA